MSQHPSLLGSQKGKGHRSVFKRYEKLKYLMEKGKWDEEKDSVYHLPKIKSIKFKIKKEKAAAAEAGAAQEGQTVSGQTPGAAPQTQQQPTVAGKPQMAPGKPQAGGEKR